MSEDRNRVVASEEIEMNSIAHFEILQADQPERAMQFYDPCFQWKFTKQENLPIEYWRIETAGIRGELLKRPASAPPAESGTNAYVCSLEVDEFDASAEHILAQGGEVALPKFAVPGVC